MWVKKSSLWLWKDQEEYTVLGSKAAKAFNGDMSMHSKCHSIKFSVNLFLDCVAYWKVILYISNN